MVDRNKVMALPSYKEILTHNYKESTGKIQAKRGSFKFDKSDAKYWEYKTYTITSTGKVRAGRAGFDKVIGDVDFDKIDSYDKAFKAIIHDIDDYEIKLQRRDELAKKKEKYVNSVLREPPSVKRRIIRHFFIHWVFEDMVQKYLQYPTGQEGAEYKISRWKKALKSTEKTDEEIKFLLGGGWGTALNKENVRIVNRIHSK